LIENGHPLELHAEQARWRPRFGPPYELSRVLAEEGRELHEGEELMSERRRAAARGALCAAFTLADQGRAVGPVRLLSSGFDAHSLAGPLAEAQHEADACLRKLSAEERRDPEVLEQTVRGALRRALRRRGVRAPEILVVPTAMPPNN
jgi:mRNA degradation ribonuclease J1/J2